MQQSDRAGLLYALAGFALLSVGDAIIKGMAGLWPPTAMAATRYVIAALALSAVLTAKEGRAALWPMPRAGLQWWRGAAVALSSVAMFTAVWLMPLAEATSISFTQPILTALLAVPLLGERIKPAAILATLLAFAGVIVVLRPNFAEIGLAALWPLLAALGMAVLMIANRAAAGAASALAMQTYIAFTGTVVLVLATVVGHFTGIERFAMHWPAWHVVARCAFIAGSATVAHLLIYKATQRAGAATVAPMTYGQLLAAVVLGYVFYGELPDAIAMLGAGIIIAAGLWLWYLGRAPQAPSAPTL